MALAGTRIECGFGGGSGKRGLTLPVIRKPAWSLTIPPAGGTTSNAAPNGGQEGGDPIFHVYSTIPVWLSCGTNPDATVEPRKYIKADVEYDVYVDPGDKPDVRPVG